MLVDATVGVRATAVRAVRVTRGSIQLSGKVFASTMTATNGLEVEAGQELLLSSTMLPSLDTPTNFASVGGTTRSAAQLASDYVAANGAKVVYKAF